MDLSPKVAAMLSFIEAAMWECRPALSRTVHLSCYMKPPYITEQTNKITRRSRLSDTEYKPVVIGGKRGQGGASWGRGLRCTKSYL